MLIAGPSLEEIYPEIYIRSFWFVEVVGIRAGEAVGDTGSKFYTDLGEER